ncbi:respiratory chain complex I subunit 1 family protein [Pseudobacteroides cellulosolvens]|uniref:Respiratory-chain NADH dehydrogenase subunit 1 n=1 Tax=Pseudobacteroides cellulosolvens ATCC 35603 = DSM 2933 TaxID=398512 RepID=A0A0L6JVP0_9FIRM|nr:NADH-quinone oxidoreductase subunit H [Pseudobacteroides cellulosolvens]KNY29779.1 respiratory-chain NADH dehydrogenase subunit 1 [Pseudobacteroides cellulosolvens ATCC 35603 = DSM 2933]
MNNIIYIIVQLLVILLIAPLISGIIKKVKALSQKRKGPPVLQLYLDIYKLLKKDTVISDTASWIFKVTPYINITTALLAGLLIPVSLKLTPIGFGGDVIFIIYILAMGRFFMTLAGLDTGSTFGGMGSSREMAISSMIEPTLLVSVFTVGLISKSTSIHSMMETLSFIGMNILQPVYILCFLAMIIVIIAETCRIPVDDPATHLELTMVHEAMLLEYSGRHLALMELGAAVKQLVLITLLVNLFIPLDSLVTLDNALFTIGISILLYITKVVIASILIAIAEVNTVKLKLFSVPNLAAISFILSFLGFLQYFIVGGSHG